MSFRKFIARGILLQIGALVTLAQMASAQGDAGCGLGSVVFTSNKKLPQILAVTTNATFGSQTFGITSGTSNCKANGIAMVDREQIFYAENNFDALTIEMAQGRGEHLNGLATLMGCDGMNQSAFGAMTKSRYKVLLPTPNTTPVQMLESLRHELRNNSDLANVCLRVS